MGNVVEFTRFKVSKSESSNQRGYDILDQANEFKKSIEQILNDCQAMQEVLEYLKINLSSIVD